MWTLLRHCVPTPQSNKGNSFPIIALVKRRNCISQLWGEGSSCLQTRLITGCPAGLSSHVHADKSQTYRSHFPLRSLSRPFCFQDLESDAEWPQQNYLKMEANMNSSDIQWRTQRGCSHGGLRLRRLGEGWQGVPVGTLTSFDTIKV